MDRQDWSGSSLGAVQRGAQADVLMRREGPGFVAELRVTPGAPALGAYWALTEDGHVSVVSDGENEGSTLRHDAVVRQYELTPALALDASGAARLSFQPRIELKSAHSPRVVLVVFDLMQGRPIQALACPA